MENEEQPKPSIEQQASDSALGGGQQAIQGDNNSQQDNSITANNRGNAKSWQTKVDGGIVYIAENITNNYYAARAPQENNHEPDLSNNIEKPQLQPKQIPKNPFTPLQGKVIDKNSFFGRVQELNWVFDTLNEGSSVAIIGAMGIGKSSLLWAIKEQAGERLQIPRLPIYIDMSQVINESDFYDSLCSQVGIATVKGYSLTRALENHDNKFLLLLDGIESMAWEGFTNPVRNQLRGLANDTNPPLRLVVAASKPLDVLFPDSSNMTSPFKGICREEKISLWNEKVIVQFIRARLELTPIEFTETEILQITAQSRGFPRDLMRLCHDLYKKYCQQII
jgi:hypothetical protein